MNIAEQVEEYLEAEKALARLANISPDEKTLILLDINMPVMNGWDFLNQYLEKNQHRKDKIIMLSSSIDFQDQQKAKKYDCVEGFIEKPLTPDKFKNLL